MGASVKLNRVRFAELSGKFRDRARQANIKDAQDIAATAYQLCPVSDNRAADHIHTRDTIAVSVEEDGEKVDVRFGGASLFLEFGTVNMEPHPFIRPAIESVTNARARIYKDIFKDVE